MLHISGLSQHHAKPSLDLSHLQLWLSLPFAQIAGTVPLINSAARAPATPAAPVNNSSCAFWQGCMFTQMVCAGAEEARQAREEAEASVQAQYGFETPAGKAHAFKQAMQKLKTHKI